MVKRVWHDFKDFLRDYNVVTLAVAFVMGAATNELVKSLVNDMLMPLVNPLIPSGNWETAVLKIGLVELGWGSFVSSILRFIILAFVIFILVKKIIKHEKE